MPGRIKSKKPAHSKTPYSRSTAKPQTKRSKPSAATKHANELLRDELDSIFATEQSDLRGVSVKKDTRGLVKLTRNQERERKIKEQQDLEDMLSLMEGGFGKAADLGTPDAKRAGRSAVSIPASLFPAKAAPAPEPAPVVPVFAKKTEYDSDEEL
ncbi:hypothetical protein YB2330_000068 [Saitoella coloradoensis]